MIHDIYKNTYFSKYMNIYIFLNKYDTLKICYQGARINIVICVYHTTQHFNLENDIKVFQNHIKPI